MYTTAELAQVFWTLYCYVIYIAIRSIFHFIDSLLFKLGATNQSSAHVALVSKVLIRYSRDAFDFARPEHFLTKRQYLMRSEDVITDDNDRIVLYCIDREYATFIELRKSISEYGATTTPFIWLHFFRDALSTIRIPTTELNRLAARLGDPQSPIVLLWNSGRCGSTLLCKLITTANARVLALSEPDIFSSLHALIMDKNHNEQIDSELIRSTIRVFFRRIPKVDGFVVKPRMLCTELLPYVHEVMPNVKHALLYRRNVMEVVRSYERSFRPIQDVKLYYMTKNFPLIPLLIRIPLRENQQIQQAAAEADMEFTVFEIMCRVWANTQLTFVKFKELFEGNVFPYEDFMKDPVHVLETLFGLLNMGRPNARDVEEWMKPDAQAASPLSREVVKENEKLLTPLDNNPHLQKRLKKFMELLKLDGDI